MIFRGSQAFFDTSARKDFDDNPNTPFTDGTKNLQLRETQQIAPSPSITATNRIRTDYNVTKIYHDIYGTHERETEATREE